MKSTWTMAYAREQRVRWIIQRATIYVCFESHSFDCCRGTLRCFISRWNMHLFSSEVPLLTRHRTLTRLIRDIHHVIMERKHACMSHTQLAFRSLVEHKIQRDALVKRKFSFQLSFAPMNIVRFHYYYYYYYSIRHRRREILFDMIRCLLPMLPVKYMSIVCCASQ
jgi:hypothetical protein